MVPGYKAKIGAGMFRLRNETAVDNSGYRYSGAEVCYLDRVLVVAHSLRATSGGPQADLQVLYEGGKSTWIWQEIVEVFS